MFHDRFLCPTFASPARFSVCFLCNFKLDLRQLSNFFGQFWSLNVLHIYPKFTSGWKYVRYNSTVFEKWAKMDGPVENFEILLCLEENIETTNPSWSLFFAQKQSPSIFPPNSSLLRVVPKTQVPFFPVFRDIGNTNLCPSGKRKRRQRRKVSYSVLHHSPATFSLQSSFRL